MEYEIRKFTHEQFGNLIIVEIDNETWFYGNQVAETLGYVKPRNALEVHVDKDDKIALKKAMFGDSPEIQTTEIWNNPMDLKPKTFINESGIYSLIMNSQLPTAKKFKHWVTHEVLPALRKTGTYSIVPNSNRTDSYMIEDPIERAKAWIAEQEERNRLATENNNLVNVNTQLTETNQSLTTSNQSLTETNKDLTNQINSNKDYTYLGKTLVASEGSCTIAEIAALLAKRGCKRNGKPISRNQFFQLLRDHKFLKIINGKNQPTQAAINAGILELTVKVYKTKGGKTMRYTQTMVTPKGQEFFLSRWEQARDNNRKKFGVR